MLKEELLDTITKLFSLKGRNALITGGGAGLGAEMAFVLAGAGAHVTLVGRRQNKLDQSFERIENIGGTVATIVADLNDDIQFEEMLGTLRENGREIDILINGAGINPRKPAETLSLNEWDTTLRLNLTVPFRLARNLVSTMQKKGWGRIINIASLQSIRAFPNSMAYGASKGGITQLTRAMAEAWSRDGVCCNAIAPGLFPTELTQSIFQNSQALAKMAENTCCGRNAELSDIWGLTLFLASPSASFVTRQTIYLDGGYTAK